MELDDSPIRHLVGIDGRESARSTVEKILRALVATLYLTAPRVPSGCTVYDETRGPVGDVARPRF